MKKSLFILLVLSCVPQISAADIYSNDYTYTDTAKTPCFKIADAAGFTQNGTFAITLNLPTTLSELQNVDLKLTMSDGNTTLGYVSFAYVPESMTAIYSPNGNFLWPQPEMNLTGLNDASTLVFQISDLYDSSKATYFTLSYYNSVTEKLNTVVSTEVSGIKTGTVSVSELIFKTIGGEPIDGGNIMTWNGAVTGSDIAEYLAKSIYWVNSNTEKSLSDIKNDSAYDSDITKTIALKGGTLVVNQEMLANLIISSSVAGATGGVVEITNGTTLNKSCISAASDSEIKLSGGGTYNLENGLELGTGISLDDSWSGTVCTGDINPDPDSILALHTLGNDQSCVQLSQDSDVIAGALKAAKEAIGQHPATHVKTVKTPKSLSLVKDESKAHNLEVNGLLTLGTADSTAKLTLGGNLTLKTSDGIKLGNIASSATAEKLDTDSLNVTVSDSELQKLPESGTTVLTLGEEFTGTTTLNGTSGTYSLGGKLIYELSWKNQLSRAAANQRYLVLNSLINPDFVPTVLNGIVSSHNGSAGMNLLNDAYTKLDPQTNMPEAALAALMNTVDAGTMTDAALAAAAGSSVTVLGQALSGDTERQLKAIRNRAVSGIQGSDTTTVTSVDARGSAVSTSTTTPHAFCVWVNAEGNRAEQDAESTAAGYTLSSWGGTVGAGMQVTDKLSLGLALSAMYGELKSEGADHQDGDMDTTYLSAFTRYQSGSWSHSFVGTIGTMDAEYKRAVNHATGSYTTSGDTEGTTFGLMYELSKEFALNRKSSISPVFNISYRHTEVDGYSERNSDAALKVDEQSLDTVTAGLGARYAATVGRQMFNRDCAFEARALAKYDFGDRQTDTTAGFIGQATHANIESAELGAFGVELGAGLSVPAGSGSIFADGTVELRSDYTNFNATVGYKTQF